MNTNYHYENRKEPTLKKCNYDCLNCSIFKKIKEVNIHSYIEGKDFNEELDKEFGAETITIETTECYHFFVDWHNYELGR